MDIRKSQLWPGPGQQLMATRGGDKFTFAN